MDRERRRRLLWRRICITMSALGAVNGCNAPASESVATSAPPSMEYLVTIRAKPQPSLGVFNVSMTIDQSRHLLREFRFNAPSEIYYDFEADGAVHNEGDVVVWETPERGGTLSWTVKSNRKRGNAGFDSYMNDNWALLRGSDLLPPATTRAISTATAKTVLEFDLPPGWASVTQYKGAHDTYAVTNPDRRFDRPTGWILLGRLGTRTDLISGIRVTVAAPEGVGARRMDMLALLHWTIPEAVRIFDAIPQRLTIFSAGDPMWRGGLSAPSSLYIHSDRPLISENGTSALMHEFVHVALGQSAFDNADWIDEGLAEYYGLQLMLRSGTISKARYEKSIQKLDAWGDDVKTLCGSESKGRVSARATVIIHRLNAEIIGSTSGRHNFDDVIRVLVKDSRKINTEQLKLIVRNLTGRDSKVLEDPVVCNA